MMISTLSNRMSIINNSMFPQFLLSCHSSNLGRSTRQDRTGAICCKLDRLLEKGKSLKYIIYRLLVTRVTSVTHSASLTRNPFSGQAAFSCEDNRWSYMLYATEGVSVLIQIGTSEYHSPANHA